MINLPRALSSFMSVHSISRVATIVAVLLCWIASSAQAQTKKPKKLGFKPYMFFRYSNDSPEDHDYGAFHYTNVHRTLPAKMVQTYYQSGLFHTWYRPNKIYGLPDFSRDKYGYHAMEGGAGYKPYLRFRTDSNPIKFTTGAVAGGFGSFSNGPGQGVPSFKRSRKSKSYGWERNVGRYGSAQLSNRLLYPMDGVGFETNTNNQMLGYGYYALPLTDPKSSTAGSDAPSGNRCWTLFFHTSNFSGPVSFFTPYHWSKYSINKTNVRGKCFDSSLLKLNSLYQRETNVVPVKKWEAPDGDTYFRVTTLTMPADRDRVSRYGSMPMTIDSTKWDQLEAWFKGGKAAPESFGEIGKEIHVREFEGGNFAFKIGDMNVSAGDFSKVKKSAKDPSTASFQWKGDLVKPYEKGLVQLPEYYRLEKDAKTIKAIAVDEVPKESKLTSVRFPEDVKRGFNFAPFITEPIISPLHPDYKFSNDVVEAWSKPGPTAGPFTAELTDGSNAVYYWYKFNEQPAILNSDMGDAERELIQKRVELLHGNWSSKAPFFPEPKQKLAGLDPGLIVTPPKGLEVGYVPICVHQQKTDGEELPKFRKIKR